MRFDELRLATKLWLAMGLMVVVLAGIVAFTAYQRAWHAQVTTPKMPRWWPKSRRRINGQPRWM